MYADDAGIIWKTAEGLAQMTTVIVTAFKAVGLTVSDTKSDNPPTTRRHKKQGRGNKQTTLLSRSWAVDSSLKSFNWVIYATDNVR